MKSIVLIAAVASIPVPVACAAQTANDAATVYVQALRITLERLGPAEPTPRLWVRRMRQRTPSGAMSPDTLATIEWAAIASAFPQARQATDADTLFLCPPGVRVMMPVRGCPIRDDGMIIDLGQPRIDGDSAVIAVTLTQSGPGLRNAVHSWASGYDVVFFRIGESWYFRRTRGGWAT